jgi:predicted DCC family thiol-disulfide oxidoreductase YuxK
MPGNLPHLRPISKKTTMMTENDLAPEGRSRDENSSGRSGRYLTVWYDGACPLCRREIALFQRLDRRGAIRFQDVGQAEAACPLDRAKLLARFHAQEAGQPLVSGAAAFAAMWRAIPILRPVGELARIPPVLWLLEQAYVCFLRLRPGLQKLMR